MKMTKQLIILMSLATIGAVARPQHGGGESVGPGGREGGPSAREGGPRGGGGFVGRLDQNSDGKISESEFDGPAEHFSKFDKNGDGSISEDEAPKGPPPGSKQGGEQQQQRPPNSEQDAARQGEGKGKPQQGAGFTARLDQDGDGNVSSSEFDGPEDAFSHLDQNNDGYISEEEAPKGPPPRNQE